MEFTGVGVNKLHAEEIVIFASLLREYSNLLHTSATSHTTLIYNMNSIFSIHPESLSEFSIDTLVQPQTKSIQCTNMVIQLTTQISLFYLEPHILSFKNSPQFNLFCSNRLLIEATDDSTRHDIFPYFSEFYLLFYSRI